MSEDFMWFKVNHPDVIPEYLCRACVDAEGRMYISAVYFGGESEIKAIAWDSDIKLVSSEGHIYVPTDWARREFPDKVEGILKVEKRIQTALNESQAEYELLFGKPN